MKLLSVVILTYNSNKDIINCIDSIYKYCDLQEEQIEIIIVDNSKMDVYEEMKSSVKEKFGEKIIFIKNNENKGYGQGNNVGIKAASAKYICIVNPDVIFVTPMFKKVLNSFSKDKNIALIGGRQHGGMDVSFWIRPEYDFFVITAPLGAIMNKINCYFQKYFYLSGALLFVDKEKFEEIGMFDENLFLYCEESDITKRILNAGYKTVFRKEFEYKHLIDDREAVSDRNFNFLTDSLKKYFKKYHFNFERHIKLKILSYNILKVLYKIFGKTERYHQSVFYLKKYSELQYNLN